MDVVVLQRVLATGHGILHSGQGVFLAVDRLQYIYFKSPYFFNMQELWTDWPQRDIDGLMKGYMLAQWAYWIQQILVVSIEAHRKDYWQMIVHHVVTITLITTSYAYHHTRAGNQILVLMDIVDLILPVSHLKFHERIRLI